MIGPPVAMLQLLPLTLTATAIWIGERALAGVEAETQC